MSYNTIKSSDDCPCGKDKVSTIMDMIEKKLASSGASYMKTRAYDLSNGVDIDEMSFLLSLRGLFLNKVSLCSDCFNGLSLENICSKILRILY